MKRIVAIIVCNIMLLGLFAVNAAEEEVPDIVAPYLISNEQAIYASHFTNAKEKPEKACDGDEKTKWCANNTQDVKERNELWLAVDFGEAVEFDR